MKAILRTFGLCLALPLTVFGQSWSDSLESGENGFAQSEQFGAVYTTNAPWYYFFEWTSWLYGEAPSVSELWLYKPDQPVGWYWSGNFPSVYYQPDGDWLYVQGGYTYNFTDETWRLAGAPARVVVRKEVSQMTDAEIAAFVDTLIAMKNTPSAYFEEVSAYDYFVMLHEAAFMCMQDKACPHQSSAFLPWHREMLRRFELEMQRVSGDPTMALPYWDWTNKASLTRIFSPEFLGDSGQDDPDQEYVVQTSKFGEQAGLFKKVFVDFTDDEFDDVTGNTPTPDQIYLTRSVGGFGFKLPTEADMERVYAFEVYDVGDCENDDYRPSFRVFLEGGGQDSDSLMHNGVHNFVAGDMATGTSPNDPVFYLHHCNIDRVWAVWQGIHGAENFPDACKDEDFYAFDGVTPRDQFDYRAIGYRYTDPKE